MRRTEDVEQELEAERHRRREMFAMIGHELRNPLAGILGAIAMIKARGPQSRELDAIKRHARRLEEVFDQLLEPQGPAPRRRRTAAGTERQRRRCAPPSPACPMQSCSISSCRR
jgi:nitrogen-specific signal transduction histidine kinase